MKLFGAFEDLVRQVIRAARGDGGIDHLQAPRSYGGDLLGRAPLAVVDDESEDFLVRPRKQSARVRQGVTHGHIDDVGVVPGENLPHPRHKLIEALNGDEVLAKAVGLLLAIRRLELGDVVARFPVAPGNAILLVINRAR